MRRLGSIVLGSLVLASSPLVHAQSACSAMSTGDVAALNGYRPFPANDAWNTDISSAPVDARSAQIISFIGSSTPLHADFGSGTYNGTYIGIPYVVVSGQPMVPVPVTTYPDESDPGPMPIPSTAPIEGDPNPSGDAHVLVLDRDQCWLYELWTAKKKRYSNQWTAGGATVWDLLNNEARPWTWTSADAAGLPIFPGLARYDEVAAGHIDHALRFTVPVTRQAFVPPATHWASSNTDTAAPPMGMRLRLKAGFDISGFPPQSKVLLTAMKQYGLILADNGSGIFISGTPDSGWNNDDLSSLRQVPGSAFDVVQMDTVYTPSNVPSGPAPTIASFTASASSVTRGTPVTLSWTTRDSSYLIVSPQVGPVRGSSVVVKPTKTTTYTLYATGRYGRSTQTLKITVR